MKTLLILISFLTLPILTLANPLQLEFQHELQQDFDLQVPQKTRTPQTVPPVTVPYVDVNKYQGEWYEIAKIENSFQKKCLGGTTAEYKALASGELQVLNSCTLADGSRQLAEGRARIHDKKTNAKLKVTFANIFGRWIFAFSGDYWVIGLDHAYNWAIIGHPTREYGWVLSRGPSLNWWQLREIKKQLLAQGYNTCDFMTTPQVGGLDKTQRLCD